MITKDTARKIYNCHHEIEKAGELLKEMKTEISKTGKPELTNAFGEKKGLQLGVPSSNSSQTLYDVPPELAYDVIAAHIRQKDQQLKELMAIAKIELNG